MYSLLLLAVTVELTLHCWICLSPSVCLSLRNVLWLNGAS